MRRRHGHDEAQFSEINITPFTDVILVLLIIFMITSPFLISGAFHVKLPKAASSETQVSKNIEVFLTENNDIIIDGKVIAPSDVASVLKAKYTEANEYSVIIKADKGVLHGNFIKLLDLVKISGAGKILVAATKTTEFPIPGENQ